MVLSLVTSTFAPAITAFGEGELEASLYEVMSESTDTAEVTVFSSSDDSGIEVATDTDAEVSAEEGLEVLENYTISDREEDSDETLWVKADPDESVSLQPEESMAIYSVEDDEIDDVIIEDIAEADDPCEIEDDVTGLALVKDSGYRHLSFAIDPETGDSYSDVEDILGAKSVSLDGMMPKNAIAEAVDVTEMYSDAEAASLTDAETASSESSIIAAYDITIKDGEDEYQPSANRPIAVAITDPVITTDSNLRVFHIKDDGEKEEITDFSVEDGRVSFSAVGFSVYEIVDDVVAPSDNAFFDAIAAQGGEGFYVSLNAANTGTDTYYFTGDTKADVGNTDRTGLVITDKVTSQPSNAVKLYFERPSGANANQFNIYIKDGDVKKYIRMFRKSTFDASRSALEYGAEADATLFTLAKNGNNQVQVSAKLDKEGEDNKTHYWVRNTKYNKIAIVGYAANNDTSMVWLNINGVTIDSLNIDGKTYGLMNYTGGTHGYALMADEDNVHSLVELVTHKSAAGGGNILYVDEGSEVTRWTFHSTVSGGYTLSGDTVNGTKYLAISEDSLIVTDSAESATVFDVNADGNGRIQLKNGNKYVTFSSVENDGKTINSFILSETSSSSTWLNFIDFAEMDDNDLITYSADRVSVSDVKNGQKVIVYTRIWDETNLKYDIYAIDYDGTLYPCYASGGKILWLGDGTGSLEWEFTEYLHEVTKLPNYYYDLYNPYSEKYIAPQLTGNQVLSDEPIGINMQGRREGEFYSEIIAWDNTYYSYIGLKPVEETVGDETIKKLVPCAQTVSVPFYFAVLEDLNQGDELHKVDTINNVDYGITMKMQDFPSELHMNNFLGNSAGGAVEKPEQKILSTYLGSDGYPVVMAGSHKNESLAGLYDSPTNVNHLFIDSIYESSGYFEFDSCQNFATLCEDDGSLKEAVTQKDAYGNDVPTIDFTVYKELGTTDNSDVATRKHGQFFPYDNIVDKPISKHTNTYGAVTNQGGTKGELPDSDPRKYEKMYNVGNNSNSNSKPNYYNGMELEASFVQTVSGLDAWGHDIIFDFTGDDDFWLYVDGELLIDLGGKHSALAGNVNFRTGKVTVQTGEKTKDIKTLKEIFKNNFVSRYKADHAGAEPTEAEIKEYLLRYFQPDETKEYGCEDIFADYSTHTMRIFYMERGAGASNLHMRFNISSVKPGNVVVAKEVKGEGAEELDLDFIEYPFQIYYTVNDGEGGAPREYMLTNSDEHIYVTYQNTNKPVTFVNKYRPPGFSEEEAYDNVFYINPKRSAEISFPDDTISYRIVECAVDEELYGYVKINGELAPVSDRRGTHELVSYTSDSVTAGERPTISFENGVNSDIVKDLHITKRLVDEDGNPLTEEDDSSTFDFRLYLSPAAVDVADIPAANMHNYCVLYQDKYLCRHNPSTGRFESTGIEYSRSYINNLPMESEDEDEIVFSDVVFPTSGFGAISNIPVGYTICVPGLAPGTVFKVTEDYKSGYGVDDYVNVMGSKQQGDETIEIPSYYNYPNENSPDNIGCIRSEETPQMEVINKQGYSLSVNKKWSDLDITTAHSEVFVAVYVGGELLDGSVKRIESPSTSTYYFWPSLKKKTDGTARTDLTDYEVKEVLLTGDFTVAEDGTVTGYDSIDPIISGGEINITATRTEDATPEGEGRDKNYDYVVSYEKGKEDGSIRTDTITNTRKGGIAIRLFKWNSENPLSGGQFKLTDSSGNEIGTYTSNSEGIVTMMYSFERNQIYTLTETAAPDGYVGLQKKLKFKVNDDDSISLFYDDGTSWGDKDSTDMNWAKYKAGSNGITAFLDVYNKPFNFKLEKTDSEDGGFKLDGAHFALYKQRNTTISGYIKSKAPLSGFEDMTTVNGVVDICGGNSDRVLKPGADGAVFFLEETQAPDNYAELNEDIIFRVSALGVPTIISGSEQGTLVETEDSYVYTLNVPNTKEDPDIAVLNISKKVTGNYGNKNDEFEFTITVTDESSEEYVWKKNGEEQTEKLKSGVETSFTMRHGDSVVVMVPVGTSVKVEEALSLYDTSYSINSSTSISSRTAEFYVDDNTALVFVNKRDAVIPTGVWMPIAVLLGAGAAFLICLVKLKRRGKRLKRYIKED